MSEDVKKKRSYRSGQRDAQAKATLGAILDAASKLFARNGWSGTTITAIAGEAGVAPETVYARFGNKRSIVQALVTRAMRGTDENTPFMEQPVRQAVLAAAGGSQKVEAFSRDIGAVLARVAPIVGVIRVAAESDPELQALYGELHAARRRNLGAFVTGLANAGALRVGLDVETATDDVWSLASPELYLLLTGTGARNRDSYAAWLAAALKRMLLEDG